MFMSLNIHRKYCFLDLCKTQTLEIADKIKRLLKHNHVHVCVRLLAILNLQAEEKKDRHYDLTADHSSNSRVSHVQISAMMISVA